MSLKRMNVSPDELRATDYAATNIVDDLAAVIEGGDATARTVYHEDGEYVAVLISAEYFVELLTLAGRKEEDA